MITWDEAIQDCLDNTQDNSNAGLLFIKRKLNQGYKKLIAEFGTQFNERTQQASTVASQQYYQVPYDFIRDSSMTFNSGNSTFPLHRVESQEEWDMLNLTSTMTSNLPQAYFYRPRFGDNGGDVGLWPTPSSSALTFTLVYQATDKALSQTAYVTGTANLANGSNALTGNSTVWTPAMVGRYLQITDAGDQTDGMFYRIIGYTSGTALTLEQNYMGLTASGLTYQIAQVFSLPEDMQMGPEYYCMWHYYMGPRKNDKLALEWKALYQDCLAIGKMNYGSKGGSSVLHPGASRKIFGKSYPVNFPNGIAS